MPIRVVDFDVGAGASLDAPPGRYESVRLLVRDGRMPLGYLDLPNRVGDLGGPTIVAATARSYLSLSLWARRALPRDATPSNGHVPIDRADNECAISVVVCTRDRPADLRNCLRALAQQTHSNYEVLVVDNGSRDRLTFELAELFDARYVLERRQGLDIARNTGWHHARFPFVAYADDDTIPDPDWLRGLAAGFTSPDVHAVTGLVVPAELETRAQVLFEDAYGGMGRGFRINVYSRRGHELSYWAHTYGVGCNMAFRRATLERLGGFDPGLDVGTPTGGGGDLDMLQRVIESDGAICYRPDAIIRHVHRRTEKQLRRQIFDNGRGFSAFMLASLGRARGFDRMRVVCSVVVWFWWLVKRILRRLIRRDSLPLRYSFAELSGGLLGPLHYVHSRLRLRRLRETTP